MRRVVIILIISLLSASFIYAKTIRVITPYLGTVANNMNRTVEGSPSELKLEDDSLFKGLYVQMINPDKYQWNAFIYNSEDLNYSSLWGTHFIYDYYLGVKEKSKYVIGAGFEFLKMNTETDKIVPFSNFELSQNIYAPYLRAGKYFYLGNDKIKYSVMPWLGMEADMINGDIEFTIPPFPPLMQEMTISDNVDEDTFYALAGVNFKATFYHFIDLKLKYHGKLDLDENEYYSVCSSMLNIYFSRNWGISYRAKYMKNAQMENTYHIGGIVYAF